MQWLVDYYPMGKTSRPGKFNLPGKIAWVTMESPGFIVLLYTTYTVSAQEGITNLPWPNKLMALLFVSSIPPVRGCPELRSLTLSRHADSS